MSVALMMVPPWVSPGTSDEPTLARLEDSYMKHAAALFIVTWSLVAMPIAYAGDEDEHAAHHATAQSDPAGGTAKDDKAAGMKMKMHDQMKKMQEQMEKVHATTDPQERRKLMQEHMQVMRETMKTMQGMG